MLKSLERTTIQATAAAPLASRQDLQWQTLDASGAPAIR
jgi:hypothetical protein